MLRLADLVGADLDVDGEREAHIAVALRFDLTEVEVEVDSARCLRGLGVTGSLACGDIVCEAALAGLTGE
jgi:hypothetical protein